jgi:hypothetical protein
LPRSRPSGPDGSVYIVTRVKNVGGSTTIYSDEEIVALGPDGQPSSDCIHVAVASSLNVVNMYIAPDGSFYVGASGDGPAGPSQSPGGGCMARWCQPTALSTTSRSSTAPGRTRPRSCTR